jgi:L-lysine 2,3-aminomutase
LILWEIGCNDIRKGLQGVRDSMPVLIRLSGLCVKCRVNISGWVHQAEKVEGAEKMDTPYEEEGEESTVGKRGGVMKSREERNG